jgi:hypothetical protein
MEIGYDKGKETTRIKIEYKNLREEKKVEE